MGTQRRVPNMYIIACEGEKLQCIWVEKDLRRHIDFFRMGVHHAKAHVAPASTLPFVLGGAKSKHGNDNANKTSAVASSSDHASATKENVTIVNLMDTPFDDRAALRSFAKADTFFFHLMQELELRCPTPPEVLHLHTATQMKALAKRFLPDHGRNYVGKAQREQEMASALFAVEEEMLARES